MNHNPDPDPALKEKKTGSDLTKNPKINPNLTKIHVYGRMQVRIMCNMLNGLFTDITRAVQARKKGFL